MNLLDEAKKTKVGKKRGHHYSYNKEELEVCIAWMKEELTAQQVLIVMPHLKGRAYQLSNYMASALRQGLQNGWIEIKMK